MLRKAVSVCRCPNSTSTGDVNPEIGGLVESEGCRLAPAMDASKNNTATPLGGVSPTVRVTGTPLFTVIGDIDPPHATNVALAKTAAIKRILGFIDKPPSLGPNWESSPQGHEAGVDSSTL